MITQRKGCHLHTSLYGWGEAGSVFERWDRKKQPRCQKCVVCLGREKHCSPNCFGKDLSSQGSNEKGTKDWIKKSLRRFSTIIIIFIAVFNSVISLFASSAAPVLQIFNLLFSEPQLWSMTKTVCSHGLGVSITSQREQEKTQKGLVNTFANSLHFDLLISKHGGNKESQQYRPQPWLL